jgi:hypothetical protein
MAEDGKKKELGSTAADQKNWEQRLKTEMESVHKWNENWSTLHEGGIPTDYDKRVEFLKAELVRYFSHLSLPPPPSSLSPLL